MNPLYQMLNPGQQKPVNRFDMLRQAMANPSAFVKQSFPDIPDEIANDPNQILYYLQRTRGISSQQINRLYQMYGGR